MSAQLAASRRAPAASPTRGGRSGLPDAMILDGHQRGVSHTSRRRILPRPAASALLATGVSSL
jgi:hypothetical protein